MKKLLSLILAMVMLVQLVPAFATESNTTKAALLSAYSEDDSEVRIFLDSDGVENKVILTVSPDATCTTEHYMNGNLISTATTSTSDGESINTYTEYADGTNESFLMKASDFTSTISNARVPANTTRAYGNVGTIYYKTVYDDFGGVYNNKLNISVQNGVLDITTKDFYLYEKIAISTVIGLLATALAYYLPALGEAAADLLVQLSISGAVSIVGGVVISMWNTTYAVNLAEDDVRATDPATSRQQTYVGERYYVKFPETGWSSQIYYDKYLPWDASTIAFWMYGDFWDTVFYPGIKSISYT